MKKPEIWRLVLSRLLPNRIDLAPVDWRAYIYRFLVEEINEETLRYYGSNDGIEAQNPGLDYTNQSHRQRLESFPKHKQLFRAFDKLRLTDDEIGSLCTWNGTKYAKERYEFQHSVEIKDTTWEGIEPYRHKRATATLHNVGSSSNANPEAGKERFNGIMIEKDSEEVDAGLGDMQSQDLDGESLDDDSEDAIQRSIGVELNERLLAATAARARGEEASLDADWEQWMKEASERGVLPIFPGGLIPLSTRTEAAIYWDREFPVQTT